MSVGPLHDGEYEQLLELALLQLEQHDDQQLAWVL